MKKILLIIALFFIDAAVVSASKVVNVYAWYESIPDSVLKDFERETGIQVNLDPVDSNGVLETKLFVGNSGYDVVFPTAWPYLARQVTANLFLPLDKQKLKNYKSIDENILNRLEAADPKNTFSVPFVWGLVALAYNEDKINALIPKDYQESWALIYEPEIVKKLASCGVNLVEDSTDIFFIGYIYGGIEITEQTQKAFQKIRDNFKRIRPFIKKFDTNQSSEQVMTGEICLTQQWLDHLLKAKKKFESIKDKPRIKIILPKEGTTMWVDVMAIPADAPHKEEAYAFIDYLLRPEVAAQITNQLFTQTAVRDAIHFIKPEILQNELIFPSKAYLKKIYLQEIKSPAFQKLLTREFSRILTGN